MRSSVKGKWLLGTRDFSSRTSDECVGLCGKGAHIWVLRREEFKGVMVFGGTPSKGC